MLRFRASDGRRLRGRLTPATRPHAPAVVLVHGLYGEPAQWDEFVGHLHRAGFTTLAYASRSDHQPDEGVLVARPDGSGAGAARPARGRPRPDRAGRRQRRRIDGGRTRSARGAASAPAAASRSRRSRAPREVALGERHGFRPHGLLLISDQREADNARALRADAHGEGTTVYVTEATGHGTALVADPGARDRALDWLERLTT